MTALGVHLHFRDSAVASGRSTMQAPLLGILPFTALSIRPVFCFFQEDKSGRDRAAERKIEGKIEKKTKKEESRTAEAIVPPGEESQQPEASLPGPSSQTEAPQRVQGPPQPVAGKTVFVRGLASDVSKQQLQARLESFGPVRACR
jgi:hypothetical protein